MRRILFAIALSIASLCAGAVSISGSVTNNQGTRICGLVLANGQFVFSCSPDGQYALNNVPLDASGQITIFGFADGHFPFRKVVTTGGVWDIQLQVASTSSSPATTSRDKTALLVGGTWSYVYTIINTFTDRFTFTSVSNTPNSSGDYIASGTDAFGRLVVGGWVTSAGMWGVLNQGTIIDEFYTFTFSGNNNVSGCYYQISPPGSTNLSRCYAMLGTRSPPKSVEMPRDEQARLQEVLQDKTDGYVEQGAPELYLRLKNSK